MKQLFTSALAKQRNIDSKALNHFLFLFVLLLSTFSFAQSESLEYVFDSEVYNEERTLSVFIPETYNSIDSNARYNVAYLFDGQFQPYFSMVSSIMSYYEQTNEGLPLIIVGVHTASRWGEFVPICHSDESEIIRGADQLSLFLESEVIPLIESTYRTTSFRIGIGHSLGGSFVINEVVKPNSLFNAVIAVSPNLTVCSEQIISDAKSFYETHPENRRFIYTTAGTVGEMENNFRNSALHLDSLTTGHNLEYMGWHYETLEGLNHMTTFVPSFDKAYLKLSSQLVLLDADLIAMAKDSPNSIVSQVANFYSELSLFTKEEQTLSVDQTMRHGSTLGAIGEYRASILLFKHARLLLEREDLTEAQKAEIIEMIDRRQLRSEFFELADEATIMVNSGKYIEASNCYLKAFDLGLIRATHLVRMDAIAALAQAGKVDEAFEQLDLLANKFQLGGNGRFIDDPLCKPLHKDKRWDQLMTKLAENANLYR